MSTYMVHPRLPWVSKVRTPATFTESPNTGCHGCALMFAKESTCADGQGVKKGCQIWFPPVPRSHSGTSFPCLGQHKSQFYNLCTLGTLFLEILGQRLHLIHSYEASICMWNRQQFSTAFSTSSSVTIIALSFSLNCCILMMPAH